MAVEALGSQLGAGVTTTSIKNKESIKPPTQIAIPVKEQSPSEALQRSEGPGNPGGGINGSSQSGVGNRVNVNA